MKRCTLIAFALVLSLFAWQPSADAYWGAFGGFGGYGGYNLGYGYGFGGRPEYWQSAYNSRVPPYFSLYPPVYYSGKIVRIPFGASPWAYPQGQPWGPTYSGYSAPAAPAVADYASASSPGALIANEHFVPTESEGQLPAPMKDARHTRGVMIENPFYRSPSHVAER